MEKKADAQTNDPNYVKLSKFQVFTDTGEGRGWEKGTS